MMFFIDNNLSQHLADGMRAFKEDVTHLLNNFPNDVQDADWLEYIGKRGWHLITRDERILRKPSELQAFKEYNVGAFFLGGKNRKSCDLIRQLIRNWPRIKELASNTRRPFAFKVPPKGTKIIPINL